MSQTVKGNARGKKIRKSTGDIVFDVFLYLFFIFLSVSIIYPFFMLLVQSLD